MSQELSLTTEYEQPQTAVSPPGWALDSAGHVHRVDAPRPERGPR